MWLRLLFVTVIFLMGSACTVEPAKKVVVKPIPIKVVVVSLFEIGADEGDQAGEFQLWKARQKLTTRLPFKQSHHDIFLNEETGVLGIVTGIGTAKSTAAVMALGLDQRFDLSKAYWLVAGIAGIDPEDAPIGSAAWATYVVDGDLAHEIDAREIPADWETGYFPRYTQKPYDPNKPTVNAGNYFKLNAGLTEWAYQLTKDVSLPDFPELKEANKAYTNYPKTQVAPFILKGDNLAAMTFWHGTILNEWANKWVDYWSDGDGEFVTSAMEDTGVMQSITYLHEIGAADKNRVMVLRGGSNYTVPPPGVTAVENLLKEKQGYSGLNASLEMIYRAGSQVVETLLADWAQVKDTIPGAGSGD